MQACTITNIAFDRYRYNILLWNDSQLLSAATRVRITMTHESNVMPRSHVHVILIEKPIEFADRVHTHTMTYLNRIK